MDLLYVKTHRLASLHPPHQPIDVHVYVRPSLRSSLAVPMHLHLHLPLPSSPSLSPSPLSLSPASSPSPLSVSVSVSVSVSLSLADPSLYLCCNLRVC